MARSDAVPGTRTAGANNIGVLPGTGWHETNIFPAPDTIGIPRIDTVPGTTRELWTSSDAVPDAVPSDGFRRTFHVTQIIDVGEDEDDERPTPKTVHFGSIEEAECEDGPNSDDGGKTKHR